MLQIRCFAGGRSIEWNFFVEASRSLEDSQKCRLRYDHTGISTDDERLWMMDDGQCKYSLDLP